MHSHDATDAPIFGHPLISSLPRFLKTHKIPNALIDFIASRAYFAYPRTFWLKWSGETGPELEARHAFQSDHLGHSLAEWLAREKHFHTVVFDLRDVTIFDVDYFESLFEAFG